MADIVIASDLFFGFIALAGVVVGYFVRSEIYHYKLSRDIAEIRTCIHRIENAGKNTDDRISATEQKLADLNSDIAVIDDRSRRNES